MAKWKDRTFMGKVLSTPISPVGLFGLAYQAIDTKRQGVKSDISAAEAAAQERISQYEAFEFKNPYEQMENPFEDLTINTQAADFAVQQSMQQQADLMSGLRASAGGAGAAGLAQVLQQQQQSNIQRAQADIASQEAAIKQKTAAEQARIGTLQARGAAGVQAQEFARQQALTEMAMAKELGTRESLQAFDQRLFDIGTQVLETGLDVAGKAITGGIG